MSCDPRLSLSRQVDAAEDDECADELFESEVLAEEYDARSNTSQGDEVLVDQHPVRPDVGDSISPGGEAEGRGTQRRVGRRPPRQAVERSDINTAGCEGCERKGCESAQGHGVGGEGNGRVAFQK